VALDLNQEIDPAYGRAEALWQRLGWGLIAAVLIAAVLGLFGGGLFSRAEVTRTGDDYELELSYPRFARTASPIQFTLSVHAPQQSAEQVSVTVSGEIRDEVSFTGVRPQPDIEAIQGDAMIFTWQVENWEQPLVIDFEYEGLGWLEIDGTLLVAAGENELGELTFSQFLFP
jgi:hypothetical protein